MSSTKPLEGKVALITGGSKGIGRATALRLARDGAKVVVNFSSGAEAAEEVVKAIGSEQAVAIKADVGNVEEIGKLVDATVKKFGKIDILVASAGVMRLNELDKVNEAEFDQSFNLNVKGPLFLTQVSSIAMQRNKYSTYITTESSSSHGTRRPYRTLFHVSMYSYHCHVKLSRLRRY